MQEAERIILDDLEVDSSPKTRATTGRFSVISKMTIRRAMKSSDDSRLKQGSKKCTARPLATANVVERMRKEAKIEPKDSYKNREEESGPLVKPGFDNRLKRKLSF